MNIDWKNLYKVRISNCKDEMQHHEVVKLLLVMKILKQNKRNLNWTRVYTEFEFIEGRKCDVYYENIKDKCVYAYEIQKNISPYWQEKMKNDSECFKIHNMNTHLIIIDINLLSKNIDELNKQLDEYIY